MNETLVCRWLIGLIALLPQIVMGITSRWFDGLKWWDDLPDDRKVEIWSGLGIIVGIIIGLVTNFLLKCSEFPGWLPWVAMIATTLWNYFWNRGRHRVRKAKGDVYPNRKGL